MAIMNFKAWEPLFHITADKDDKEMKLIEPIRQLKTSTMWVQVSLRLCTTYFRERDQAASAGSDAIHYFSILLIKQQSCKVKSEGQGHCDISL
jgi:hypothetical protein